MQKKNLPVVVAIVAAAVSAIAVAPSGAAPAPARTQAIYAYDSVHQTVIREGLGGGQPTVLMSKVAQVEDLAVDSNGNVIVQSAGKLTKIPAGGGKPTPFAAGVTATGVATDAKGDVFVGATAPNRLLKYDVAGKRTVVGTTRGPFDSDASGNVTQVTIATNANTAVTTYPAAGGNTTRLVGNLGVGAESVLSGTNGRVYIEGNSGGGTGFRYWVRVEKGSTTKTEVRSGTTNTMAGIARDGTFYQAQSQGICFHPPCNPGYDSAATLTRVSPAAAADVTATPISGFSIVRGFTGPTLAIDEIANAYAAAPVAGTPALVKINAAGGPAQKLTDGTFSNVTIG